jgi:hypothetical protein
MNITHELKLDTARQRCRLPFVRAVRHIYVAPTAIRVGAHPLRLRLETPGEIAVPGTKNPAARHGAAGFAKAARVGTRRLVAWVRP